MEVCVYILNLKFDEVFKNYDKLINNLVAYDTKENIIKLCKQITKEIKYNKDDEFIIDKCNLSLLYDKDKLKDLFNNHKQLYNVSKKRLLEEIKEIEYKYSLLDIDKEITEDLLEQGVKIYLK